VEGEVREGDDVAWGEEGHEKDADLLALPNGSHSCDWTLTQRFGTDAPGEEELSPFKMCISTFGRRVKVRGKNPVNKGTG
jgi:hypothetical protein